MKEWTKTFDINLRAVMQGTILATQVMKHNPEGGVILNTASMAGLFPGMPVLYGASKYGVSFLKMYKRESWLMINPLLYSLGHWAISELVSFKGKVWCSSSGDSALLLWYAKSLS
jgi:hypothetical protein